VLDREADVGALGLSINLDAVLQGGDSSRDGRRLTILWQVLVRSWGAEIHTILVAPTEVCRIPLRWDGQVIMGGIFV